MYHLRLAKGLSYSGIVQATAKKPDVYTDDKAVRDAAIATGYFEEIGAVKAKADTVPVIPAVPTKTAEEEETEARNHATELSKMTVEELKAYASINGIPLGSARKKEAILKAVIDAEEKAAKTRAALRG